MTRSIESIRMALGACGLPHLFARLAAPAQHGWPDVEELLGCFADHCAVARSFDPDSRQVMERLGLAVLEEPRWWKPLIAATQARILDPQAVAAIADMDARLRTTAGLLPDVLGLLSQRSSGVPAGFATLEIILVSDDAGPPPPLRLSGAIGAVTSLWDALSELQGRAGVLTLAKDGWHDPVSARFVGEQVLMDELKNLLLSVWEQVMVHYDLSLDARLSAIPPSLAIMDRIAVSRPGAAAGLRRRMQDGVRKVLETGLCIPEMRVPERFSPAELMRPHQGFAAPEPAANDGPPVALQAPAQHAPTQHAPAQPAMGDLVAEERSLLGQPAPSPLAAAARRPRLHNQAD